MLDGRKLAISVDRLDYSKGLIQRLRAYEAFLEAHPEWHERIGYIHLVVPSRDTVRNYKELKEEMDRLISAINGKYATLTWQPIRHFYQSVSPELLAAMYKLADVALVTPLRDGMNLVSKEFVACNIDPQRCAHPERNGRRSPRAARCAGRQSKRHSSICCNHPSPPWKCLRKKRRDA